MVYTLDDILEELTAACEMLYNATQSHSKSRIEDAVNWIRSILNEHKEGPYAKQVQKFYDEYINKTYG